MDCIFSIEELMAFAIKIEEEGVAFYKAMADQTKDPELKKLYTFLSTEEELHQKTFNDLLEKVKDEKNPSEFDDNYNQYLRAFVDTVIFKKDELKDKLNSDGDVIDFAIEKEKDSILYYLSLKDCVPETERALVDKIIDEERTHVIKFLDIREKIN